MKTKIDLSSMEVFLAEQMGPSDIIPDLMAIEERYVTYLLRDEEGVHDTAADELYTLRQVRKQLALLL